MGYNINRYTFFVEVFTIKIVKTAAYQRSLKKLEKKHMDKETGIVEKVERLIIKSNNMNEVMLNPLHYTYYIEKKNGNLKEYYTARLNGKIRLFMKPIGDYPYNLVEITDIEFVEIDDDHYGDG